jgi:hypothetical protein
MTELVKGPTTKQGNMRGGIGLTQRRGDAESFDL